MSGESFYEKSVSGDWTYLEDSCGTAFVFKKGSMSDPVVRPLSARTPNLSDRRDWLVSAKTFGQVNPELAESLCNLLNREGFR